MSTAPTIRAKFNCHSVVENDATQYGGASASVILHAVYGDGTDNASWSKATPFGRLEMGITNPDAIASFEVGRDYWVDLTLVEAAAPVADPAPASDPTPAPAADPAPTDATSATGTTDPAPAAAPDAAPTPPAPDATATDPAPAAAA